MLGSFIVRWARLMVFFVPVPVSLQPPHSLGGLFCRFYGGVTPAGALVWRLGS